MDTKFTKSSQYPGADWLSSIRLIKNLYENFEFKPATYKELANIYKVSATTKSFTSKISGAKQFGLIEIKNGLINISDDGKIFLNPLYESKKNEIIFKCIKKPKIFSDFIDRYNFKKVPNLDTLADILVDDYNILEAVKYNVAKIIISSLQQCYFIVNGILVYSMEENRALFACQDEKSDSTNSNNKNEKYIDGDSIIKIYNSNKNAVVAKLLFTKDATKEDIIEMKEIIEIILKRQFNIDK